MVVAVASDERFFFAQKSHTHIHKRTLEPVSNERLSEVYCVSDVESLRSPRERVVARRVDRMSSVELPVPDWSLAQSGVLGSVSSVAEMRR